MSKGLEKIVASLELCKLIPAGEFNESALVWIFDHQSAGKSYPETEKDDIFFFVEDRNFATDVMDTVKWAVNRPPMYPAPTLVELLEKLDKRDKRENKLKICPVFPGGEWSVGYAYMDVEKDFELTNAALRLWMKLKGIESK